MFKLNTSEKINKMARVLYTFFQVQKYFTFFKNYNSPFEKSEGGNCRSAYKQAIFALWHAHQFALYDIKTPDKVNVMISRSRDGEFIAKATEMMGFKTVRGSKGKEGSVQATLTMLERLKKGESGAITVDGPRGPKHIVKDGIIKIAKKSGVPIIPLVWYSPDFTFIKFNSWDEFRVPVSFCRISIGYGEPIFVDENADKEYDENKRVEVENALLDLYGKMPEIHGNLFSKRKSK